MFLSQTMYQPKTLVRRLWRQFMASNFMLFLLCFLFPCIFFYMDVTTDIILAVAYNEEQKKTNFWLTLCFIVLSYAVISSWSIYTHIRQPDDLTMLRRVPKPIRLVISFIIIFWTFEPFNFLIWFQNKLG